MFRQARIIKLKICNAENTEPMIFPKYGFVDFNEIHIRKPFDQHWIHYAKQKHQQISQNDGNPSLIFRYRYRDVLKSWLVAMMEPCHSIGEMFLKRFFFPSLPSSASGLTDLPAPSALIFTVISTLMSLNFSSHFPSRSFHLSGCSRHDILTESEEIRHSALWLCQRRFEISASVIFLVSSSSFGIFSGGGQVNGSRLVAKTNHFLDLHFKDDGTSSSISGFTLLWHYEFPWSPHIQHVPPAWCAFWPGSAQTASPGSLYNPARRSCSRLENRRSDAMNDFFLVFFSITSIRGQDSCRGFADHFVHKFKLSYQSELLMSHPDLWECDEDHGMDCFQRSVHIQKLRLPCSGDRHIQGHSGFRRSAKKSKASAHHLSPALRWWQCLVVGQIHPAAHFVFVIPHNFVDVQSGVGDIKKCSCFRTAFLGGFTPASSAWGLLSHIGDLQGDVLFPLFFRFVNGNTHHNGKGIQFPPVKTPGKAQKVIASMRDPDNKFTDFSHISAYPSPPLFFFSFPGGIIYSLRCYHRTCFSDGSPSSREVPAQRIFGILHIKGYGRWEIGKAEGFQSAHVDQSPQKTHGDAEAAERSPQNEQMKPQYRCRIILISVQRSPRRP